MDRRSRHGLDTHGIQYVRQEYWNLPTPALYDESVGRREGTIAHLGPLCVRTGEHTGRAAKDKYIVRDAETEELVWWEENQSCTPEQFHALYDRLTTYMRKREVYIQDLYAGASPEHRLNVRVITEEAWHSLFARNLFIIPDRAEYPEFEPGFTVIDVPSFEAIPEVDGTRSGTFVILNFTERMAIIGGTSYAGEIKKSVFTVLNYLLPQRDVLSMHCSANVGERGDVALFFGLSGTGKTSLSADPERGLIGDDEHGWNNAGVFNIEGGCYAKVIRLSREAEPEIYATTEKFGTILENVVVDPVTRYPNLDDAGMTENTRAAYPVDYLSNVILEGTGEHPRNVIFLTADAFGVLPPVARLTPDEAMDHFLSGYTAKVAGTETGVTEPQATFSACFGAPFMALHPTKYAKLLKRKLAEHGAQVWLVNTGWTGGPFGVGERMPIHHTRAMLRAVLSGRLNEVEYRKDPVFGFEVPVECPDVPAELLDPRSTWRDGEAYDAQAQKLAAMFTDHFARFRAAPSPAKSPAK